MQLPQISCYAPGKSGDRANAMRVDFLGVTVWFSYDTPVAFKVGSLNRVVRQNEWSTTTGKHLNAIDGGNHKDRVSATVFGALWNNHTTGLDPLVAAIAQARL